MADDSKEPQDSSESGLEQFFKKQVTRRELFKLGAVVGGAALAGKSIKDFLDEAKTKEEQEEILTGLTSSFLAEYDFAVLRGLKGVDWRNYSPQVESERESARFLMEQGSGLVSAWSLLGKAKKSYFDEDGRLHLEDKKFAVNENNRDFHFALNLIRAKLALLVETDKQEKELLKEDCQDLIGFLDLGPEVEISPKAWPVMPKEWAISIARFSLLLKNHKIPPPQKIVIDPEAPRQQVNIEGFYESTTGRAPTKGQILTLIPSPWTDGAALIYHEGGHYIADVSSIAKRSIGLPKGKRFPAHQYEFERRTAMIQKQLFEKDKAGEMRFTDELNSFISDYSVTNSVEDFAETFTELCLRGPFFRELISKLEVKYPAAAYLLKTKLDYIRTEVLEGEELSFEGRRSRPEILAWEKNKLPKNERKAHRLKNNFVEEQLGFNISSLKDQLESSDIKIKMVVPENNFYYAMSLLQPLIWRDILRRSNVANPFESTSAVYPVVHLELQGKFNLPINTSWGEAKVPLDTQDPYSIERFVRIIPEIEAPKVNITLSDFEYSQETLRKMAELGISSFYFSPYGWQRMYISPLVENPGSYYIHFQWNGETKNWETKPLDVRTIRVHEIISKGGPSGESEIHTSEFFPVQLGRKDVILVLNQDGKIQEIRLNNL